MTFLNKVTRRPDVVFHASGRIDLKRRAALALGVAEGDVINVAAEDGRFYLCISSKAGGVAGCHRATCRPATAGGRCFRAHSRSLCSAVIKAMGDDAEKVCVITGDPLLSAAFGIILPIFKLSA